MCHLLLGLPLIALPVFWLWPLPVALPLYAAVGVVSLLVYVYAWKVWRMPRLNGLEAMRGVEGKVVDVGSRGVTLFVCGELWSGEGVDKALAVGDAAVVIDAEGLRLRVRAGKSDTEPACVVQRGHHWFHQLGRRKQS
jgi:membrane-bound ClpP family serine protease